MPFLSPHEYSLLDQSVTGPIFGWEHTFARHGVLADGSCFFYSLCAAFNVQDFLHRSADEQRGIATNVRCSLVENAKHAARFNELSADYGEQWPPLAVKGRFCNYHVTAEEPMIRFAMERLKVNLYFLDATTGHLHCNVHGNPKHPTALIAWIDHKHFEPIGLVVPTHALGSGAPSLRFVFDPSEPLIRSAKEASRCSADM